MFQRLNPLQRVHLIEEAGCLVASELVKSRKNNSGEALSGAGAVILKYCGAKNHLRHLLKCQTLGPKPERGEDGCPASVFFFNGHLGRFW